jgi:hypothetical protein
MMDTAADRQAFRKRLVDLSDVELAQWSYLAGLAARVETELLAYHALFDPGSEISPAPTTELAGIQLLLTQEMRRRNAAKAKRLHIEEGGENHAHNNGAH